MKKYIIFTALAAITLAASAQETMYLIKGDQVVAKYSVDDIDYAAFSLPDGVTDNTTPDGTLLKKTYISASPVYYGTDKASNCGIFQIQLSTKGILEDNPPLELLYLQISTPKVTDIKNIDIAEGTYTLGNPNSVEPLKFYAGKHDIVDDVDVAMGTLIVERPDNFTTKYILATDGALTIKKDGSQYNLTGMLKLDNGSVLELSYDGPMVVINQSDEQPPADEVPLPISNLNEDYTFTPITEEAYVTSYSKLFADAPNLDYHWIMLYGDSNYENSLDIALVVDTEKHPDILLPKGKYTVFNRQDGSISKVDLGACPAFDIITDVVKASYGCWLKLGYVTTVAPLITGEVEVLEDVTSWSNVKIRFKLNDNAETPHTVSGEFNGSLFKI